MRKPIFLGMLVLLAVAGVGLWLFAIQPGLAATPKYMTAKAARGDIEVIVSAEGRLKPQNLVAVGAQVSGRITAVSVAVGDQVRKGQLIAQIDSVTQQNALATAKAALTAIQAQKAEKAAVLDLASKTLSRQENLVRNNRVTQSDYDTAAADVTVAQAQIAALDAQIDEAEVAIRTAEANLDYTRITAPEDGTVLAIVNRAGMTVNAAQSSPTIVVLGQLDWMEVHAEISEADIGKVQVGQKVRFNLLGETGRSYDGVLQSIAPAPQSIVSDSSIDPDSTSDSDSSAIYYIGLIPAENADGHLRSYMTAQVSIVQGQARDVLTIPAMALGARNPDGSYVVRVLDASGNPERRNLQIGLNDKVMAEVTSGLAEGDQVVTGEASATSDSATRSRGGGGMMGGGPPPMGG